jgi:hypothetical protein
MSHHAPIKRFWKWFAANSDRFRTMQIPAKEQLLDEIQQKLHAIDKHLYFEVSEPHDGINEFVITAEGNRELFPLVDRMIALAPRLDRWKFTGLRPPMGFGFRINYETIDLDPEKLWFMPLTAGANEEHFGLRIGIPRLASKDKKAAINATWILLDTGLGERQTTEVIEHVELVRLPRNREKQGYLPLPELAEFLKWRESKQPPKA